VSSEYPGGQPSQYPPRPSQGPQWSPEWQPSPTGAPASPGVPRAEVPTQPSSPPSVEPSLRASYGPAAQPQTATPARFAAPSSKRPRWLVPVIAIVLVLLIAVGALYVIGQQSFEAPLSAANAFCTDLKTQKYSDAYTLLSPAYQARVDAKTFAEISQIHDQLDGKVQQCGLAGLPGSGGFGLNINPTNVSFTAQIIRNRGYSGVVTLVKQNGDWKIDALDDAVQGSDIGALVTGNRFCLALTSRNYAAAYNMFTPAYQRQIGTVDAYTNGLNRVFGGGQFQITGCEPQLSSYTVAAQGDSAALSGAFTIKVTTDAGAQTVAVPMRIAFAKIAGAWKISDLEVVQSQG
jgi:ketosteroid isomerase-like protein